MGAAYQKLIDKLGFHWKVESDFCGMCLETTKYTAVSETGVMIQLWKALYCNCPNDWCHDPNYLFVCWGKKRNPYKNWASFVDAIKLTHKQITDPPMDEPPKPAETAAGAFFAAILAAKAPVAGVAVARIAAKPKERLPSKEWPVLGSAAK